MERTMSETRFTPGPWEVRQQFIGPRLAPNSSIQVRVARVNDDYEDPEANANARLIAAAPDLLRALRDLLEIVEVHGIEPLSGDLRHEFDAIVDGAVQDARRALAAATGTAKTPQAVECEASQSGPKGSAQPSEPKGGDL
jgi:hypothetical protein